MATIFCMNCGVTMPEETRFCPECGSPTLKEVNFDDPEPPRRDVHGSVSPAQASESMADPEPERTQPLTCPACGAINAVTSRFCNACGTLLIPAATDESAFDEGMQPVVSEQDFEEYSQGIRRRTLAYGLAALGVVALLIGGAVLALGQLGDDIIPDTPGEAVQEDSEEKGFPAEATGEIGEMGTAGTVVHSTLSEYSWSELSIISRHMSTAPTREQAMGCAREYHLVDDQDMIVQDTIDVEVEGIGTVPMRIAGIYHDDLASGDGKAGLTFLAADLTLTHAMKDVDDNTGGWEQSQLRIWLQDELTRALDPDVLSLIRPVDKHTNNVGNTTSTSSVTSTFDTLWVPSVVELCGPVSWDWTSDSANSDAYNAVLNAEGTEYELFEQLGVGTAEGNAALAMSGSYGAISWWTRSSSASKSAHFRIVDAAGNPSRFAAAPEIMGVCLGFCL